MVAPSDPTMWIKVVGPASQGMFSLFRNLVRNQVSIFLLGAKGSGKTSFGNALQNASAEVIFDSSPTTGYKEGQRIDHFSQTVKKQIHLVYHDYGGEPKYGVEKMLTLSDKRPLGILFFIDHRDTRSEQAEYEKAHRPFDNKALVRQWYWENRDTLGRIDRNRRLREHRAAFDELIEYLETHDELSNYCRVIIPVISKSDLWSGYHTLSEFNTLYTEKIKELLTHNKLHIGDFMPVSNIYRTGISDVMEKLFQYSGSEIRILKWKFRLRGL